MSFRYSTRRRYSFGFYSAHVQSRHDAFLPGIFLQELEVANQSLAVELSASPVHDEAEVEAAITALAREPGGGLIAAPDGFINNHRRAIMTLTERRRLPAIYG